VKGAGSLGGYVRAAQDRADSPRVGDELDREVRRNVPSRGLFDQLMKPRSVSHTIGPPFGLLSRNCNRAVRLAL
jgi:hypothetical protein